jgi:23S rRNA (uracil1939-C5)-methyltransferase
LSAETVTIAALGAQGDGIAHTERGPVFVPFTLPGEQAAIALDKSRGTLMALKSQAPQRVEPPCPHFGPDSPDGACGGCSLQHLRRDAYDDWKRQLVVDALVAQGLDVDVEAIVPCRPGERRRVTLTARRTEKGLLLGYSQASSHTIVPIRTCLIATPAIGGRLDVLRRVASAISQGAKPFRLVVLASASGLDIAASGIGKMPDRQRRSAIEIVLAEPGVARLTVEGEVIVEARRPLIHFGRVPITPPPGAFVQASAVAEDVMAEFVATHLSGAKRVADLFAGCGTFTLRLARQSAVHAVESDRPALAALEAAFRSVQGLKPVTTERRDLFRSPLIGVDLKPYDAMVFDPPRAGAEAQSAELARSRLDRIAAVSCNPVTLARDLKLLVTGGYKIMKVTPIDQFLWSPHVEAVALLER